MPPGWYVARREPDYRAVTDTLATVPAQQIATTLPLINWTVLATLAIGSFAVVAVARLVTPATKGFLAFTASCAAGRSDGCSCIR